MKIENNRTGKINIHVGDVVNYDGCLCWVVYREGYSFPYMLVNLTNGNMMDSFSTLDLVWNYSNLVCPADKIKITLED